MKVRLLGSAAGGGFPQWNCACSNCDGFRRGTLRSFPRREFCVAISATGNRWFLIEAPADVRAQIELFSPLQPQGSVRGSGIEGLLLTGPDLDQSLGLLTLREGPQMTVHAKSSVRTLLATGLNLPSLLENYAGINWREPTRQPSPLLCRDGEPSGLRYSFFPVPGHSPRYMKSNEVVIDTGRIGYRIVDENTGGRLVVAPGLNQLDKSMLRELEDCDTLLLDGTFWSDDELQRTGTGTQTASAMGHVPVGGPSGSLAAIRSLSVQRRIYVHINNTNPMLCEDSPENSEVRQAGVEVGVDGLEFSL
jgi:pyrroloquinoline quinone biosynthesis protein B